MIVLDDQYDYLFWFWLWDGFGVCGVVGAADYPARDGVTA